jgi:hypothetical protein
MATLPKTSYEPPQALSVATVSASTARNVGGSEASVTESGPTAQAAWAAAPERR